MPVFPFLSTKVGLAIVPTLWFVCRRALSVPPPPHRRYATGFDGWFALLYGLRSLQLLFFAFSWLHSQAVRGVGVGFEEPHLRLMV